MKTRNLSVLVLSVIFSIHVSGQTNLSGTFTSDSTLPASKSPYNLTGSVTVRNNATLTIESGCTIDLGNYNIFIGSSSAGILIANNVSFLNKSSTEKYIDYKDGGYGAITNCSFDKVFVRVEDDAGSNLSITSNNFSNTAIPIKISPNTSPVISGNSCSNQLIGLLGTVKQTLTLPKYQWDFELSGTIYIQNNATFTLSDNTSIDLKNYTFYVGNSTAGSLQANNVSFTSSNANGSKIMFKDGANGSITNCSFTKVLLDVESDAGNSISITGSNFAGIDCPIVLDVNKTPVISQNTGTSQLIGLKGTVLNDVTLAKYEWYYILSSNIYVNKSKTLTIGNGIKIDFYRFLISAGSTSAGILALSDARFSSSYLDGGYIYFRDGGTGTISGCDFNNAYIKIEDDAGSAVSIQNNTFDSIDFPVQLSANKAPAISNNTSTYEKIGLFGNVTVSNTLPKYQWNYELLSAVSVKSTAALTFAETAIVDLGTNYINIGAGSTSPGYMNATNVTFIGRPDNRGRINFNINSGGNLTHCSFDNTYIKIDNSSPVLQYCRFYHGETALDIRNAANPTLTFNDFYNNETAILHSGSLQLNAINNYWGHGTGPQNGDNPGGLGELIEGNINFKPFKTAPNTGLISGIVSPTNFEFGITSTGTRIDTSFTITNAGDIDFLITGVTNNSSTVSVKSFDRFWLLPDSSMKIKFSFTPLDDGVQHDTIFLTTNDPVNAEKQITLSAIGHLVELNINFNKINIDSFPLVKCYFTVTDQASIPIRDILKSYITLKEDGSVITDFDFITKLDVSSPVAAALVIDRSGSMLGQPLRDAKNAAIDFVKELVTNDIASVISFNEDVRINKPFTSDKAGLISSISSLSSMGATAIFDAIASAIDSVKLKPWNKAVIALTDGQDNRSHVTPDILVAMAIQYGISIYTIGLGPDAEESTIKYIASSTGGQYYYAPSSEVLAIIYRRISGQLQNQYLITYTAPVNNPFPRTIELKIDYHTITVTDSIKYTTQKQKIEFVAGAKPFMLPEFKKNSRTYFYYGVKNLDNILSAGEEIMFIQKSGTTYIPFGGTYLGNGIFQFWVDLEKSLSKTHLLVTLPDSIVHNGSYIKFENKPLPFDIPLSNYPVSESIDVFAGGTLGGELLAGGVGAGPSIAAASLSVKGTAGMGLKFDVDADGNENITRRFEAGIGVKVESPAINAVVGDVQAGIEAGVMVKGTLGQTMSFAHTMDDNAVKAKTLFLLETFSLGALSLSPDCSLLKVALNQSLSLLSEGIAGAYRTHHYSDMYGLNIEGTASLGFSVASGSGSDQNKLKLAEVGGKAVFSGEFINYNQTNDKAINFGFALEAGFSVLSLKVMGVDLGMAAGYRAGTEFKLGANFNPSDGFHSLDLSIGLNETGQVVFWQKNKSKTIGFNVPKRVITRALSSQNLISSVAPFFSPSVPKLDFQIGKDYFMNSIDNMFTYSTGPLDTIPDHITIEAEDGEKNCLQIDASVKIDGALVIGGGLELGVTLSHTDETTSLAQQATLVDGKLLPLAKYNSPGAIDLFSIKDEIEFLLDNSPKLILDLINALITKIAEAIEAGVDFIIDSADGACTLAGHFASDGVTIAHNGFVEIASYLPHFPILNTLKSSYLEPQIIDAYMSKKVISYSGRKAVANENLQSTLCLVSNCYKVNIYNDNGALIPQFEPSLLTIAVNPQLIQKFGFSEDEKAYAAIYYYNFANLSWIQIPDDLNQHPDTVAAEIDKSGTYAIGILYNPDRDKDAPEILNYYPADGGVYHPDSTLWAKLYEPAMGVGIDLARSSLKIDGNEVTAVCDPVNNIISYKPPKGLILGTHTMEMIASDYNGNKATKTISFMVNSSMYIESTSAGYLPVSCYPNPMDQTIVIELTHYTEGTLNIGIYNNQGQKIKMLFDGRTTGSTKKLEWDRTNENGQWLPGGIYFIRIKNNEKISVSKIIVK